MYLTLVIMLCLPIYIYIDPLNVTYHVIIQTLTPLTSCLIYHLQYTYTIMM